MNIAEPDDSDIKKQVITMINLRRLLPRLHHEWGAHPKCSLIGQNYPDEHWLVYNPCDAGIMAGIPRYYVDAEGVHKVDEAVI